MHDGTTPLILAARLAVEGMVEELINCHADVNAIDDFGKVSPFTSSIKIMRILLNDQKYSKIEINQNLGSNHPVYVSSGKSALHWAAAVNNVEAAIVLLKNGANKDMQNNKVKKISYLLLSNTEYNREASFPSSVKTLMCCLYCVCLRRKPLYSWPPGKEAMRLPRSYWSTLLTEKSLTTWTGCPETLHRRGCIMTSFG